MKDIIIIMIFSLFTNTRYLDGRCIGATRSILIEREPEGGWWGLIRGKDRNIDRKFISSLVFKV